MRTSVGTYVKRLDRLKATATRTAAGGLVTPKMEEPRAQSAKLTSAATGGGFQTDHQKEQCHPNDPAL